MNPLFCQIRKILWDIYGKMGKNEKFCYFFQNRTCNIRDVVYINVIQPSGRSSVVEHLVANEMVVGSSPITRSI